MARPVKLRVALTAGQQADLQQRLRRQVLSPRLRRRLECIRLADLGWPAPRIAVQVGVDQATVRRALHWMANGGLDGLADRPRGGHPARLDSRDLDAVEELLAGPPAERDLDPGPAGLLAGPGPRGRDQPRPAQRTGAPARLRLDPPGPLARSIRRSRMMLIAR
jgi:Winged helix-turn helix